MYVAVCNNDSAYVDLEPEDSACIDLLDSACGHSGDVRE